MSLASHLNDILSEILIKDKDRAPYLSDAEKIRNQLMIDLQEADSDFRKAFNGLSLSGKSFVHTYVCMFILLLCANLNVVIQGATWTV